MRIYELTCFEKIRVGNEIKTVESDLITFNDEGEIVSWQLWSAACNAMIEVDINKLYKDWPSKVDSVLSEIEFRLQEINENYGVDEYVKSQKEDALMRGE